MKKIALTMFLLIIMMATNVFAATEVTMQIVEDNVCTINLNEDCSFEKKIVNSDLTNHKVTLQLKINNNSEVIIPSGEIMLVIDSSLSMDEIVEGETTRKDLVLSSANKLVESLLQANPTSLKIGIVTFSSSTETNDEGFFITGTAADAQKVCNFTNDLSVLTDKISSIEGTGQYTNLDAGLQLAKQQFSTEDTNKYMIILTDGVPNLAVGNNVLFSAEGLAATKTTFSSLDTMDVITMLTGITEENATPLNDPNALTYGQIIQEVFGTEEAPNNGKFYKIDDTEIEQTITNEIYRDLLPIEKSIDNIKIIDYIPEDIANNFDITLTEDSSELLATIADDKKSITWTLEKLNPGESKTLKFDLVLKSDFNESIIDKILDTNEKVDITYKDFDGTEQSKTSDVTPKIKLTAVPLPVEPPKDTSTAPDPIPDAGSPVVAIIFVIALGFTILFGYKSRKI